MPLYAYAYADAMGYMLTGEVGAQNLEEAADKVRLRLGGARDFVLWDRDNPPPRIEAWVEKILEEY